MESIGLSETSVNFYQITQCHIPKTSYFVKNLLPPCPNARNLLYYRKVYYLNDFVMILSCILVSRNETTFNFVALISRPATVWSSNGLSMFVMKFMLPHNK